MKKIPQGPIYEQLSHLKGTVGLYIEALDTKEIFEINPQKVFASASIIKIPMLALLLRDAQEGRIDLDAPRTISDCNRVGGTGILHELDMSYQPTLSVLATLMIILSDNTATNEIIDVIQMDRFNEFCRTLGIPYTVLMRKMLDLEAIRQGRNNYMCAGEAGRLLSEIARGELVSAAVSQQMENILLRQQYRHKLPALLPVAPAFASAEERASLMPGTVLVANKTGDLPGIQHDVGIFTLPDRRRYVIAMFTGELETGSDGISAISSVSRVVYDALQ